MISLISTQLDFASFADLSDLEAAIKEFSSSIADLEVDDSEQDKQTEETIDAPLDEGDEHGLDSDIWPPKVGQFVFGLF